MQTKYDIINNWCCVNPETKMMMNLQSAMPDAVLAWLAFLKLEDDSRKLRTVSLDGFWDEWFSKGPWVKGGQTMLLQSLVWQPSQGQSVQKPMKLWRHRVRYDVQMNTKRPLHRNLNDHKWAMITDTLSSTWCYHVQTNPVQIHRLVKLRRTLSH